MEHGLILSPLPEILRKLLLPNNRFSLCEDLVPLQVEEVEEVAEVDLLEVEEEVPLEEAVDVFRYLEKNRNYN
jgi:hypothetical protein